MGGEAEVIRSLADDRWPMADIYCKIHNKVGQQPSANGQRLFANYHKNGIAQYGDKSSFYSAKV
jgi:hypothetical protein